MTDGPTLAYQEQPVDHPSMLADQVLAQDRGGIADGIRLKLQQQTGYLDHQPHLPRVGRRELPKRCPDCTQLTTNGKHTLPRRETSHRAVPVSRQGCPHCRSCCTLGSLYHHPARALVALALLPLRRYLDARRRENRRKREMRGSWFCLGGI
jgi:hypothetical protein